MIMYFCKGVIMNDTTVKFQWKKVTTSINMYCNKYINMCNQVIFLSGKDYSNTFTQW